MEKMKISVVIPCRNESKHIEECIDAIYSSDGLQEVELNVFVVDGMSDDGTREILQRQMTKYNSLHCIDNKAQTTPNAFNLGINEVNFDYLLIVGARHILSPNYLGLCLKTLVDNSDIWCVGGQLKYEFTTEKSWIISKAMSTSFGMGIGNFRTLNKSGFTDTVTSPMYPKHVFEQIGLFDEKLMRNQDDDFNYRLTKAGGKIWFSSEISLKYYVRSTFKQASRQFFQYGYWKVFVNRKHKRITSMRQLIPPFFVLFLLLIPLFIYVSIYSCIISLSLLGFYAGLNLLFSIIHGELNPGRIIGMVSTYFIIHLSYGFGYLRGILDFIILRRNPSKQQHVLTR